MHRKMTRRAFNQAGATAALGWAATVQTARSAERVTGANDHIRLGFLGVVNRGGQLIDTFMPHNSWKWK